MNANPIEEFVTLFNDAQIAGSAKDGPCWARDTHDGAQLTLMGWEPDEDSDEPQISLSLEAIGVEDVTGDYGASVDLMMSVPEFDNFIADLIAFRDRFLASTQGT